MIFVNIALSLSVSLAWYTVFAIVIFFDDYIFTSKLLFALTSFSILSAIILSCVFFASKTAKINIVGCIYLSLLALIVVELMLSSEWFPPPQSRANQDPGEKGRLIENLRASGINAYPAIAPKIIFDYLPDGQVRPSIGGELFPMSGISHATTVVCKETEKFFVFESDRHGFNNPDIVWESQVLDIVITGDSFAQGSCLDSNESFVSLIRQKYPLTLNLAMAANGPLLMLAAFKEYTSNVKPSVVLWTYTEDNDVLNDISEEWRSPFLLKYLYSNFSQNLLNKREILDKRLKSYLSVKKNHLGMFPPPPPPASQLKTPKPILNIQKFFYFSNLRHRLNMAIGRSSKWVDRFGEVLDHGRALARQQGAQFYMVYLPSKRRYANSIGRLFQDIMRERILTLVQDKLRIPVVDLVPVFDVAENPSELFLDHYTAIGNRLVANTILRELKKSNLH